MKVDVTKIEGYAEMSAEDKVKALESYDIPDANNLKELLSKKNSEIADLTKKIRERMSESERAEAERTEADNRAKAEKEELLARLNELENNNKVAQLKSKYLALGYTEANAQATAEAMNKGDFTKVFEIQAEHEDLIKKNTIAAAMNKDHLSTGNPPNTENDALKELAKAMGL